MLGGLARAKAGCDEGNSDVVWLWAGGLSGGSYDIRTPQESRAAGTLVPYGRTPSMISLVRSNGNAAIGGAVSPQPDEFAPIGLNDVQRVGLVVCPFPFSAGWDRGTCSYQPLSDSPYLVIKKDSLLITYLTQPSPTRHALSRPPSLLSIILFLLSLFSFYSNATA